MRTDKVWETSENSDAAWWCWRGVIILSMVLSPQEGRWWWWRFCIMLIVITVIGTMINTMTVSAQLISQPFILYSSLCCAEVTGGLESFPACIKCKNDGLLQTFLFVGLHLMIFLGHVSALPDSGCANYLQLNLKCVSSHLWLRSWEVIVGGLAQTQK